MRKKVKSMKSNLSYQINNLSIKIVLNTVDYIRLSIKCENEKKVFFNLSIN